MNERDSTKVAYETGPKEVRDGKGLPSTGKQFGKDKMPQKDVDVTPGYPANPTMESNKRELRMSGERHPKHRHKEFR
jgi:hypothetical protein